MSENKIIFEVDEDEKSSSPMYIALASMIVTFGGLLTMFSSVTPGFG